MDAAPVTTALLRGSRAARGHDERSRSLAGWFVPFFAFHIKRHVDFRAPVVAYALEAVAARSCAFAVFKVADNLSLPMPLAAFQWSRTLRRRPRCAETAALLDAPHDFGVWFRTSAPTLRARSARRRLRTARPRCCVPGGSGSVSDRLFARASANGHDVTHIADRLRLRARKISARIV